MYGQTNCFVLPDGEYAAYDINAKAGSAKDVFICSEHSARNMAYQEFFEKRGEVKSLATFKGWDLLGLALSAPNCTYEKVYTLPLLTIKMDKGTGIVTSVPSDAPDDFIALRDLQRDADLRAKYKITKEMVDFEVVPIINIPGGDPDLKIDDFKNMAAKVACETMKIENQHDKAKLARAKKRCYLMGFEKGKMLVGTFKGVSVKEAKDKCREEMVKQGTACVYWEPENLIMSRTDDKCVVAFLDQWYLTYGEEEWRDAVMEHVKDPACFETFDESARKQYLAALLWMGKWACSRSFGLGTKMPWDKQFVIESLSDSTIYMAYYTVAHLLQGEGNMDGQKTGPSGVTAAQMTDDVWNYIFSKGPKPNDSGISDAMLRQLRHEFEFWYPLDLRVSAKDLIRNHLTMALYNHRAIWSDRNMMPKAYYVNGHVMVDAEKMSKSKGNFITLLDSIRSDNMYFKFGSEENVPLSFLEPSSDAAIVEGDMVTIKGKKGAKGRTGRVTKAPKVKKAKEPKAGEKPKKKGKKPKLKYDVEYTNLGEWVCQSWTVDTVRLALGDAGDSMEDSNFESDTATDAIMRLTKELEWFDCALEIETEPKKKLKLRDGPMHNVDKIFLLKIKECLDAADASYRGMQFKQAIKACYYELQNKRDDYRNHHRLSQEPMHRGLLRQYVAAQVVSIAPVCPHWAEWIWTTKLQEKGSVTSATWPDLVEETRGIDATSVLRRAAYIEGVVNDFRAVVHPKKKKKKVKKGQAAAAPEPKKTKAVVYVRKTHEQWRLDLIKLLVSLREADGTFSKQAMGKVVTLAQTVDTLSGSTLVGKAKKLWEKKLRMKAAFIIKKVNGGDATYLDAKLPFDEIAVLNESVEYIAKSLDFKEQDALMIVDADDSASPDSSNDAKASATPGDPKIWAY